MVVSAKQIHQVLRELRSLGNLTEVVIDMSRLPDLAEVDPEKCYLSWNMGLATGKDRKVIEAVFEFVREDSVLKIEETTVSSSAYQHETRNEQPETLEGGPKPLGEILVESGVVSPAALDQALAQQKKVGEILVEQKMVTPQQLEQALQKQKQQESSTHAKETDTASIRVDTGKIDKLINLVGELVITNPC